MTDQNEPDADASIDPFDCLPPTRKNFANAALALAYYEPRAKKARKAQQLLEHGSTLARTVVEHAQAAAADVRRLTPAELRKLGMSEPAIAELEQLTAAPEQLGAALVPMVATFGAAAEAYGQRAKLLEETCAALLAQATKEGSLS